MSLDRLCIGGLVVVVVVGCGSDPPRPPPGGGVERAIDAEGGAVSTDGGELAVIVPPGALSSETTVGIRVADESLPGADSLVTAAYELTPAGASFDVPVTLSFAIPPSAVGSAVVVVTLDELRGTWDALDGSVVIDGRVYAQTDHFSFFGVSLPAGPVDACIEMLATAAPGTVHPLVTPGSVQVGGATRTATAPSGFSGGSPLELGSTWTASQRFAEVTGNAGIAGEGAIIDWSTQAGDTFTVESDGSFSHFVDLHTQGPFFGLTDACLGPTADERNGWLYALNVHCDQDCMDDPATMPPGMTTCGPTELCMRSIDECGASLTMTDCEAFYMSPASCLDMPAYITCNCTCITEPTCTDYFDCGQICFDTHCM